MIEFVQWKPGELKERSEWLFWHTLLDTDGAMEDLGKIFEIKDPNLPGSAWQIQKRDVLFETLLWQFGNSVRALEEKLSEQEIKELISELLFWVQVMFPAHKFNEIIDVFVWYKPGAKEPLEHKIFRIKTESWFIQRFCSLFSLEYKDKSNDKIRDQLFIKIPWGWLHAIDAFLTTVEIGKINEFNLKARGHFRESILLYVEKIKAGKTEEEIEEDRQWNKKVEEENKLFKEIGKDLDEELERRKMTDNPDQTL